MKKEVEISAPKGYSFKEFRDGKVVFEKEVLPTSWEEYCKAHPITAGECIVDGDMITFKAEQRRDSVRDANVIKNEETAKAFLALNKLIHLRDCYRQGWKPNWNDREQERYCIVVDKDAIKTGVSTSQRILSFPTPEDRNAFLKNFKDLIEQAKELL